MAVTDIAKVQDQVQTFWSSMFMQEFREQAILPSLVNKKYEGEIRKKGDTVRVSMIREAEGSDQDASQNSFETEAMSTSKVDLVADRRAVASFEFDDLSEIQSQIGEQQSAIRQALLAGVIKRINNRLYSLVSPSTSSPDHVINGVSDFDKAQYEALRVLAGQAKWPKQDPWYLLLDPSFHADATGDTTLGSKDYRDDAPLVNGEFAQKIMNFWTIEDNTDGLVNNLGGSTGADCGLAFHPDFMLFAAQTEPTFQISSQHSNKRFGYLISVDLIYGAKLSIDGDKKHIRVYNS